MQNIVARKICIVHYNNENDLRLTTYDLRLTTYDLRLTTYDLRLTTYD